MAVKEESVIRTGTNSGRRARLTHGSSGGATRASGCSSTGACLQSRRSLARRVVPGRNGRRPQGEWIQFVARIPGKEYGALASN